jgi:hypothetical protein
MQRPKWTESEVRIFLSENPTSVELHKYEGEGTLSVDTTVPRIRATSLDEILEQFRTPAGHALSCDKTTGAQTHWLVSGRFPNSTEIRLYRAEP